MLGAKLPPRSGQHRRAFSAGGELMRVRAELPGGAQLGTVNGGFEPLPADDAADAARPATPPPEPPEGAGAGGSPSRSRARHRTAHERACAAIALPRAVAGAVLLLLAACCVAIPVTFDKALSGDALWSSFAAPGEYLNVDIVRAQGLPPRPLPGPHGADTDAGAVPPGDYVDAAAAGLRNPYIFARTWPATRDYYRTRTANATLAPVFQQEFTFDQGLVRARRVSLQLFDQGPRGTPPLWLGTAMVPVPGPEAKPVAADVREAGRPNADIIEGWFPFFARAEGDYESVPPPAVAEVYARVSFAKRRAHSGYCEEVRLENPIAQPMDSYSNVAFLVTGMHMLGVGAMDLWRMRAARRLTALPLAVPDQFAPPAAGGAHPFASLSQMEQFPVYSLANGLVQFYAGLSSFLFHASMTALGQRLDMAGVYMLVVSPSLYMLLRLGAFGPPGSRAAHAAFAAATAVCAYAFYQYKWQMERYTGGSTNLVLDLVAIMAALIALWLWVLGSPGPGVQGAPKGGSGGDEASPRIASGSDGGASAGTTPRAPPASDGDGSVDGAAAAQPDGWLPGLLSLRPLSARGAGGGYEALRTSDGGSNGSSPTAAAAAASASVSPRSVASPGSGPASPAARDGAALLRQLLGAGGDAWRRRRLPRAMSYRYCVVSVLAIVVAYASREADVRYDLWCMPRSWFQLHSVWHIMAALSLWSLWVFMRSEAPSGSVTRALRMPPLPPLRIFGKKARSSAAPVGLDGIDAAPAGLGGTASPRGASLSALAAAGVELAGMPVQPLSARAASIAEEGAPVGVPAAAGRSAAHLRTRSREVFNLSSVDNRDMV